VAGQAPIPAGEPVHASLAAFRASLPSFYYLDSTSFIVAMGASYRSVWYISTTCIVG